MTIWNKVWPTNVAPIKEEIERMYKCAYYLDRGFFRPVDVVDFGIDLYKLKECGEVVMKKELSKLRPHVQALWDRMNEAQRVMFLYSYLCQGIEYVKTILKDLGTIVGDAKREAGFLDGIPHSLYIKFPRELQDKINEGFGRQWK